MDAKADLWAALALIGVPLDALVLTPDAPGFLSSRPLGRRCGRGRNRAGSSVSCIPACWPRSISRGPLSRFELNLDAVGEPKRRRKVCTGPGTFPNRSGAISLSWWTAP